MAGLGTLPSAGTVLGNTPGASNQKGAKRQAQGPPRGQQPGTAQPGTQAPQTFAQMQQQGIARPAPPQAPQGSAPMAGPSSSQGAPNIGSQLQQGVSNALNSTSRYDLPQVQQTRDALTAQLQQQFSGQKKQLDEDMARRGLSASSIAGGYQGDLLGQQDTALANMNSQLLQNQAATAAQDQNAALGAGQNYQSGQLAQQLGLGNLGVAQQNADTSQTGTLGNLGIQAGGLTGQYNGQQTLGQQSQNLASQLGLGNLGVAQGGLDLAKTANQQQYGLNQGQLTGTYGGNQTLAAQEAAANNALGFGNLMGSVNGQQTLGGQQLSSQNSQFQQQLAQQLGISQMGNDTARYGIDTQAAANSNDQTKWIAQFLASMGYGPGNPTPGGTVAPPTTGNGTPATGGTPGVGTGGTPGGGATPGGGGTGTTPVPSTGSATRFGGSPTASMSFSPSGGTTGTTMYGGSQAVPNANATTGTQTGGSRFPGGIPTPTPTPIQLPGTPNAPPTAQPQGPQPYQTPMFGNSGYTGLFGNSPVQYAGNPAPQQNGSPGGTNIPLNPGNGTPVAPGQAPGGNTDLQSQVQSALMPDGWQPANLPAPGQSAASIFGQNTTANPNTGAGALNIGGSSSGTDPMSLYAQGKITFAQLQQMAVQYQLGQQYSPGTLFQGGTSTLYNPNNA